MVSMAAITKFLILVLPEYLPLLFDMGEQAENAFSFVAAGGYMIRGCRILVAGFQSARALFYGLSKTGSEFLSLF
jgi:hypothetical protein